MVILVQVLAHEINHGYKYSVTPALTFNGTELRNLRHLTDLVDSCTDQFLNFGLDGGRLITLERAEAAIHGPQILLTNAISMDRWVCCQRLRLRPLIDVAQAEVDLLKPST